MTTQHISTILPSKNLHLPKFETLPPSLEVPPFPGATYIFESFDDFDNFDAIACSRAPLPKINTFSDIINDIIFQ